MKMNIAVAIATAGRPYVLFESLEDLAAQTRGPDIVAICPADQIEDIYHDGNESLGLNIHYSRGSRGASSQRNAIIRDVDGSDVILFMDDDFAMAADYVEECAKLFADHPDVVLATGSLLADDVNGPGLSASDAREMLNTSSKCWRMSSTVTVATWPSGLPRFEKWALALTKRFRSIVGGKT
jgi:glycosyltransferase involved in cell wall biosynthesis